MTHRNYKETFLSRNLPLSDKYEYLSNLEVERAINFAVWRWDELNSSFELPKWALAQAKRAENEPDIYLERLELAGWRARPDGRNYLECLYYPTDAISTLGDYSTLVASG